MLISTSNLSLGLKKVLVHIRFRADESGRLLETPELLGFGEVLLTLAERDLRVRYKQMVLGVVWYAAPKQFLDDLGNDFPSLVLSLSAAVAALAYGITAASAFFWMDLAVFKRLERGFADVI